MKFLALAVCALVAVASADVSHLTNTYLPPHHHAASTHAEQYVAPAQSYNFAASAPVQSYAAPAAQSYNFAASTPVQSYVQSYAAPESSYSNFAASAPATSFNYAASSPVQTFSPAPVQSYNFAASAPVQTFQSAPAQTIDYAASAPVQTFQTAPAQSFDYAASAPVQSFQSAPVQSFTQESYQESASVPELNVAQQSQVVAAATEPEPAHTYSAQDGYKYKTQRRVVYRHRQRRDVAHLPSNDYLPPQQVTVSSHVPTTDYLPPVQSYAATAPVAQYESAPTQQVEYSQYETASSDVIPAHTYSATDGYRYRTNRRRVIRRNRY